ncbi:MAG TPA: phosphatase PAP2 family protein [Sedimenticola sp.]|nr:phosphatase PAP2 family protein [Sedimenticola sp.]
MTEYLHQLLEWVSLHPVWAGVVVFLVAMSESLAIIGILVPGVVLMFGFGAMISADALAFWPTFAWAVAGAVAGDGLSFLLGRHFQQRLRGLWPFSHHPQSLERGIAFFQRYGGKSVAIGRFFGPVRAVIPLVAGMLGMPPGRFLAANLASALAWAPLYLLPGMALGASLKLASEVAFRLVLLLLLMVTLIWFVLWITRRAFQLLHPHASAWVQAALNWTSPHPKLREIAAALADPDHPEAGGLAVLASLLILAMGLSALIFGAVLGESGITGPDWAVLQTLQSLRTPWADHLMIHLSRLADATVLTVLALGVLAFLAWQRHWRTAGYWLAAVGFGFLAPLILKYGLRIPRPDIGITGLGPYGFPSGHVLRAMTLFGFLSVMTARAMRPRHRWLPYGLAGLLVMAVAVARLYLGVHWLTDVLAGLTLGLAWVALLGIAYHRHTGTETHWRGLAAGSLLLLALATGLQTWRGQAADLALYLPARPPTTMNARAWWEREWMRLPRTRQDIQGRRNHPLQLQYAGSLERLKARLAGKGWRAVPPLTWSDMLKLLSPSLPLGELPVLPQVHDGRHEALILIKPRPDERRLVLRLWPSGLVLSPGNRPLWLGGVSSQRQAHILNLLTFAETTRDFRGPFEILLQDTASLPHKRADGLLLLRDRD